MAPEIKDNLNPHTRKTVYCVFEDGMWEGPYLKSMWFSKENAEAEAFDLNDHGKRKDHSVEEWEIEDS